MASRLAALPKKPMNSRRPIDHLAGEEMHQSSTFPILTGMAGFMSMRQRNRRRVASLDRSHLRNKWNGLPSANLWSPPASSGRVDLGGRSLGASGDWRREDAAGKQLMSAAA